MANPYLTNAVTLAAGLDGIKRGLTLPEEATSCAHQPSDVELRRHGIQPLPRSLAEALDYFENSEFWARRWVSISTGSSSEEARRVGGVLVHHHRVGESSTTWLTRSRFFIEER